MPQSLPLSVPAFEIPELPYRWSKKDLPHELDVSFSVKYAWISMGGITKNVWVPADWVEKVEKNYSELTEYLMGHNHYGRKLSEDVRMRADERLSDAARRCAGHEKASSEILQYSDYCRRLINCISVSRKKTHPCKITPDLWDAIKSKLQPYEPPWETLDSHEQASRLEHFYEFLTGDSRELKHECHIGEQHLPRLRPDQAEAVIRYAEVMFGLDTHDVRMCRCPGCGEFQASSYHTSFEDCEGCGLSVCEGCRQNFFPRWSDNREEFQKAEEHDIDAERFCLHCWGTVKKHIAKLPD